MSSMSDIQQQASEYASQQKAWINNPYGSSVVPTQPHAVAMSHLSIPPPPPASEGQLDMQQQQQQWTSSGFAHWNAYGNWQQPGAPAWQPVYGYSQPVSANPWEYYYGTGVGPPPPPPPTGDNNQSDVQQKADFDESTDPDLVEFDKQFKSWEEKYDKWKEDNKDHPDKESLASYEATWKKWSEDLLKKREELKKTKLSSFNTDGINSNANSSTLNENNIKNSNVTPSQDNSGYVYPPYPNQPHEFGIPTSVRPPMVAGMRPPMIAGIGPPMGAGIRPPMGVGIRPPMDVGMRPPMRIGPQTVGSHSMHNPHMRGPPPNMPETSGPPPHYMQRGPPPETDRDYTDVSINQESNFQSNVSDDAQNNDLWKTNKETSPLFSATAPPSGGIPGLDIAPTPAEDKGTIKTEPKVPVIEIKSEEKDENLSKVSTMKLFNRDIGPIGLNQHTAVDPNISKSWKPPEDWYEDDEDNENKSGDYKLQANKRDCSELSNLDSVPSKMPCKDNFNENPYNHIGYDGRQRADANRSELYPEMGKYGETFTHGDRSFPGSNDPKLSRAHPSVQPFGSQFDNQTGMYERGGPETNRMQQSGPDDFRRGQMGERFGRTGTESDLNKINRLITEGKENAGILPEDKFRGFNPMEDRYDKSAPDGNRSGRGMPYEMEEDIDRGMFGRGSSANRFSRGGPPEFGRGGPSEFGRGGPQEFGRGGPQEFGRGGPPEFGRGGPPEFGRGGQPEFGRGRLLDSFGRGRPFGRGGPEDRYGRGGPQDVGRGGTADRFSRGEPPGVGKEDRFGRSSSPDGGKGKLEDKIGLGDFDDRFNRGGSSNRYEIGRTYDRFEGLSRENDLIGRGRAMERDGCGKPILSHRDNFGRPMPPEGDGFRRGSGADRFGRGGGHDIKNFGREGGLDGDMFGRGGPPDVDRFGRGGPPDVDRFDRVPPAGNRFGRGGPPNDDRFGRGRLPDGNRFGRGGPSDDDRFSRVGPPDGARFGRESQPDSDKFGREDPTDSDKYGGGGPPDSDKFGRGGPPDGDKFGRGQLDSDEFGRGGPPDGTRFGRGGPPIGDRFGRGGLSDGDRFGRGGPPDGDKFGRGALDGGRFGRGPPDGDRFGRGGAPDSNRFGRGRLLDSNRFGREEPPDGDRFGRRGPPGDRLGRGGPSGSDRYGRGGPLHGDRYGRGGPLHGDRSGRGGSLDNDRFGRGGPPDLDRFGRSGPQDKDGLGRGSTLQKFEQDGVEDRFNRPGSERDSSGRTVPEDKFSRPASERGRFSRPGPESNRYSRPLSEEMSGRTGSNKPGLDNKYNRDMPKDAKFSRPDTNDYKFGKTSQDERFNAHKLGPNGFPNRDRFRMGHEDPSYGRSFGRGISPDKSDEQRYGRPEITDAESMNFDRGMFYDDSNKFGSNSSEAKPKELMKMDFKNDNVHSNKRSEIGLPERDQTKNPNRLPDSRVEEGKWEHDRFAPDSQYRSRSRASNDYPRKDNSYSRTTSDGDKLKNVHETQRFSKPNNNRPSERKNESISREKTSIQDQAKIKLDATNISEQSPAEKVSIDDIISVPGRFMRPPKLVIILRGLPGSGKTTMAKMIKNREIENGGSAPRILCLDDYFMVEVEKMTKDVETGRTVKTKSMEFEYEQELEDSYRAALIKSFKKQVDEKFFPFIIVDCINSQERHFMEICDYAQNNDFEPYIAELEVDMQTCVQRNVHGRERIQIQRLNLQWEASPTHITQLDLTSYMQDADIQEVEMEDCTITEEEKDEVTQEKEKSSEEEESVETFTIIKQLMKSKWDTVESQEATLDKLDGVRTAKKKLGETKPQSIEDWLQLSKEFDDRNKLTGKKRVRWADIEERKKQENARERGFVLGQTDWQRMTDPSMGSSALVQVKYI